MRKLSPTQQRVLERMAAGWELVRVSYAWAAPPAWLRPPGSRPLFSDNVPHEGFKKVHQNTWRSLVGGGYLAPVHLDRIVTHALTPKGRVALAPKDGGDG